MMRASFRGVFITIEGIEGAGKSTAVRCIQTWLLEKNIPHLLTREPGGTEISEAIRALLLHKNYAEKMCADTELLLMFASRAQHLAQCIVPALHAGKWVICDRFTDATYAYQGGGRGIAEDRIAAIEAWVQGALRPDCVLLLDLPAALGLQRAHQRRMRDGTRHDRIEQEKIDFFERVRLAYLAQAKKYPHRYRVIDASQTMEKIQEEMTAIIGGYHL
jgi:dTMP kinase